MNHLYFFLIVDDNDATAIEEIPKGTICRVKDKEYTVGQYIQSDPCRSCRCVEDFNGLISYFILNKLYLTRQHESLTKLLKFYSN